MVGIKRECAIYTILWLLYYLQGILYANGSVIAKAIVVLIISMSLIRVCSLALMGFNRYMKAVFLLLIMYTVYGVLHLFGEAAIMRNELDNYAVTKFYYLKDAFLSILPLFSYGYYCDKGVINENSISKYIIAFFIVAVLNFYNYSRVIFATSLVDYNSAFDIVNNMGYRFVPLIPLVYFFKRFRLPYIFICFAFIVMGLKRGALVIGSVLILLYVYRNFFSTKGNNRKGFFVKISAIILLAAALVFVNYYVQENEVLLKRINKTFEGDASGRDAYAHRSLDYLAHDINIVEFFVGGGANTSVRVLGNYAHNDWLEIAMNNGAIGIFLLVNFLLAGYLTYKNMRRKGNAEIANAFGMYLLTFVLTSLFSMAITGIGPVQALGVCYCLSQNNKQHILNENTLSS